MGDSMITMDDNVSLFLDLNVNNDNYSFTSSVKSALSNAEIELQDIDGKLNETTETISNLTPECDKIDYALSASTGMLCGIIDIFLIGKPNKSPLDNITDKWFEDKIKDFANHCCPKQDNSTRSKATRHLEKKFKVPYDQRGAGDAAKEIYDLSPTNHHYKSLAHNPSILGLFFSILDQFDDTSHFVTEGELVSLQKADEGFELHGNNIPSKLFCAFANWIGHLISDISGSSSSKRRGMGIPAPLWSWANDVIVIKTKLNIPISKFDKSVSSMAVKYLKKGMMLGLILLKLFQSL